MYWRIVHRPAGDQPSREYVGLEAAQRKLSAFLNVPVWTLR